MTISNQTFFCLRTNYSNKEMDKCRQAASNSKLIHIDRDDSLTLGHVNELSSHSMWATVVLHL